MPLCTSLLGPGITANENHAAHAAIGTGTASLLRRPRDVKPPGTPTCPKPTRADRAGTHAPLDGRYGGLLCYDNTSSHFEALMIHRIRVRNFKSIVDVTVDLRRQTIPSRYGAR